MASALTIAIISSDSPPSLIFRISTPSLPLIFIFHSLISIRAIILLGIPFSTSNSRSRLPRYFCSTSVPITISCQRHPPHKLASARSRAQFLFLRRLRHLEPAASIPPSFRIAEEIDYCIQLICSPPRTGYLSLFRLERSYRPPTYYPVRR